MAVTSTQSCASCGATLGGPYCARCGERVIDRHELTLGHFLAHGILHEFTHVDGKIVRTFRYLLFRPGFLSVEYFGGRRRAYVKPVRLLLTAVVIFALAGRSSYSYLTIGSLRLALLPPAPPVSGTIQTTTSRLDVFGVLSRLVERTGRTKDLTSTAAVERFHHELKNYATALSFANVILLAALLALLFHRRRDLFVEHLVFSLHLASFVLLFGMVTSWATAVLGVLSTQRSIAIAFAFIIPLGFGIQIVYLYRALRCFYYAEADRRAKWWSPAAWLPKIAVLVVLVGNSACITFVYAAGAAIALARLP